MWKMRTSIWKQLIDVLLPRRCVVCGRRLTLTEQDICAPCLLAVPRTGYEHSAHDNPMARLLWARLPLERAAAWFFYSSQTLLAQAIYDLKYHGQPEIGFTLGRLMAAELRDSGFFDGIDVLLPLPLAKKRQRQRGYNQSEMLARGIEKVTGIAVVTDAVKRTRYEESQTRLQAWERQANVEGLFVLNDATALQNRHVLLVDDVMTTGATVMACAAALKTVEGIRISVLTAGFTKS